MVSGAAGGVGTAGVQLAHAAGAFVVASVRNTDHHDAVGALGADVVVEPDGIGAHGPFDVSLELVGAPGVAAVLPLLAIRRADRGDRSRRRAPRSRSTCSR